MPLSISVVFSLIFGIGMSAIFLRATANKALRPLGVRRIDHTPAMRRYQIGYIVTLTGGAFCAANTITTSYAWLGMVCMLLANLRCGSRYEHLFTTAGRSATNQTATSATSTGVKLSKEPRS
jgi:uncharacterized membrane protein YeiB